jgi:hypothetical protein
MDATPNMAKRISCSTHGLKPEICAVLGYYVALRGSSVPTFRHNLSGFVFKGLVDVLTLEDGTERLSRNVRTELPLNAA